MKRFFNYFFIFFIIFCSFFSFTSVSHIQKTTRAFSKPKLAIVIDDFGSYDETGVDKLLTITEPLTCAVLPNTDNTQTHLKFLKDSPFETILHMPMQSHVNLPQSWYGPVYISNTDSAAEAYKKLDQCLSQMHDVKGFNIHIGSGVSQNEKLMTAIYDYSKQHGLYFLDSRTIETNEVTEAAKETNSIYLGRDEFLEADKNKSYSNAKFRLLEGARRAIQTGSSIVIGHVGAEGGEQTAKAILDTLPEIKKMGVEIVPLSTLYEIAKMHHPK